MFKILQRRVLYKFLLFALPLAITSILVTGLVLSWTNYTYFMKTINQDYRNIIISSAGEIRLYMENSLRGLESLARVMASAKLDRWHEKMALTAFKHTCPEFIAVSMVSPGGEEIVSTGREGKDRAFTEGEVFRKAAGGQSAISRVEVTAENIPYVYLAVPLLRLGEVEEVLWAELNLKSVWDVLEGIQVGDTGEVFIMDFSGRLIGHREIERVMKADTAANPEIVKRLKNLQDDLIEWTEMRNGEGWYCLGYAIPGLRWVVVLSQREKEIFAHLHENIRWAAIITFVICVLAVALGWSRMKRILRPVHDLHRQVQRIGEGQLDERVIVNSQDEIGDLAAAFNEMADSLKRFIKREVEAAKELVHAKNLATLGAASSKVTHEVGNLLNNIMMVLVILKSETLSPSGQKAMQLLDAASRRVETFIRDFLQFAKKPELTLQRVSLEKTIDEIVYFHKVEAEKRDIELQVEWPTGLPPVSVDLRLMHQVLSPVT